MKIFRSLRFCYLLAAILIAFLLGGAHYLQQYKGVQPCPLCMLQRYTFTFLGVVFFLGALLSQYRIMNWFIGLLSLLGSLSGIILAGRQTWLQYMPVQAGANCEVSLDYMFQVLPIQEIIRRVFAGGSGCSRVTWEFMNLSLAQWSLGFFILFLLFSIWQLMRKNI